MLIIHKMQILQTSMGTSGSVTRREKFNEDDYRLYGRALSPSVFSLSPELLYRRRIFGAPSVGPCTSPTKPPTIYYTKVSIVSTSVRHVIHETKCPDASLALPVLNPKPYFSTNFHSRTRYPDRSSPIRTRPKLKQFRLNLKSNRIIVSSESVTERWNKSAS